MNRYTYRHDAPRTLPATQLSRRDLISAQLVEIGIVIQSIQGTTHAAAYLHAKKVDIDVALRVLSQPLKRRTWAAWDYARRVKHSPV